MRIWDAAELLVVGFPTFAAVYLLCATDVRAELRRGMARISARMDGHLGGHNDQKGMRLRTDRNEARHDMPLFLDVVTLGLEAGLSFDASLELYCRRYDSFLASLLANAQTAWRMGYRKRDLALADVAKTLHAPSMERVAMTVGEALALGTPLASALERQAQAIRDEQRAEVEAEIERIPVKMLIPLGTLIVPAMLLAILGPLLGPAMSL